jgi:hypothetical protein
MNKMGSKNNGETQKICSAFDKNDKKLKNRMPNSGKNPIAEVAQW